MKSSSKILILAIFLVFICCVSAASAAENDNVTASGDELAVEEVAADDVIDEQDTLASQEVDVDEKLAGDSPSEYVVWVGTNSTPGGQGTEDDPFPTLDSACAAANSGGSKSKVTVNIKEREEPYYIGSFLQFDTHNLCINGSGSVILKNSFSSNDKQQSFGFLSPESGNFTMNNIIFDASDYNIAKEYRKIDGWFSPFMNVKVGIDAWGDEELTPIDNNIIEFNNCQWVGYENHQNKKGIIMVSKKSLLGTDNITFNYCKFSSSKGSLIDSAEGSPIIRFNYCVFGVFESGIGLSESGITSIFDSCWLGHNNGYTTTFFMMTTYSPGYLGDIGFDYRSDSLKNSLYANRHAVLAVSENYLGDNTYEIIGKLLWNDGADDNIDKLGPMTVYLSADNGNIPSMATLENGTFNVTYTSDSDYHEIVVVLDSQKIKLNNKINFTLNAPTITYGGNQNITVTFPTNVKGTVYVTANNNTYHKYVDDQNNVTVPIDDILAKGNYPVQVSFAYDKNEYGVVSPASNSNDYTVEEIDSFGFNSTTLSVSGIGSSLTTSPVTTTYNTTKELVATLTDINGDVLVNKPVHIVVGTIDETLNTTSDGKVSVDVSGLVPSNYVATISFAGDESYDEFSTTTNVIVNKVIPNVNISCEGDLLPGKKLTIKVEIPYATENVTIIVNGDKNTTKLVDNTATYTIDELAQGTYYVIVLYAGDDICEFVYKTDSFDVVKSTADLINELNSTIASQASEIGNLSATVVAQNATIVAQQEQINNLKKTSAKVVVSKKATKLTAPKKTFKVNTKTKKVQVKLTSGKTVLKNKKVTLKVKGVTYTAKTNKKGIATFKITKLTKKGTFKYTVKFAGDKAYKAVSKNGKIKIK